MQFADDYVKETAKSVSKFYDRQVYHLLERNGIDPQTIKTKEDLEKAGYHLTVEVNRKLSDEEETLYTLKLAKICDTHKFYIKTTVNLKYT